MKRYRELILLPTLDERFEYLKIGQKVGEETFGFDRYLNQTFYESREWRNLRNYVIARDGGNDMALNGNDIQGLIVVHHINPITVEEIKAHDPKVLDPDNLVCVADKTHKAIHYGDKKLLQAGMVIERTPFDTCPWKQRG